MDSGNKPFLQLLGELLDPQTQRLGPRALLHGRAGGSNVGDALLTLSSLPPAGFTPGTCKTMTAPLETTVRNCTHLPANASHCCWICITLVLRGFLQRSFGWCCWFAGSRRCLHLENVSLFATQQVRTVRTHTHVCTNPPLCTKLCIDHAELCVPSASPLHSLAAISGRSQIERDVQIRSQSPLV